MSGDWWRGVINVIHGETAIKLMIDHCAPVLRVNTVLLAKGFLVIDVSLMTSRTSFVRAATARLGPAAGFYDELSSGWLP